jgi:hypothetical protein
MPRLYIRLTIDTPTTSDTHAAEILAAAAAELAAAGIPPRGTDRRHIADPEGRAGLIGTLTLSHE